MLLAACSSLHYYILNKNQRIWSLQREILYVFICILERGSGRESNHKWSLDTYSDETYSNARCELTYTRTDVNARSELSLCGRVFSHVLPICLCRYKPLVESIFSLKQFMESAFRFYKCFINNCFKERDCMQTSDLYSNSRIKPIILAYAFISGQTGIMS